MNWCSIEPLNVELLAGGAEFASELGRRLQKGQGLESWDKINRGSIDTVRP